MKMTIQAIWYQSACRAWKRTFWERSLYSSQTSRAPKGIRPTSATSTLKWAIMDQVRSSCALIVPAEAPAWPSETCSRSPPRLGSCCIFSPSVPVSVFACIQEYGHRHDSPKRDADVSPKWVIFRCFSRGGDLPRRAGNNRIQARCDGGYTNHRDGGKVVGPRRTIRAW